MGDDPGGYGGHVPSNIWAGGQHTVCPPPNNLPQNDQVLVLHFNYAFQIRARRHFGIQHFFLLVSLADYF